MRELAKRADRSKVSGLQRLVGALKHAIGHDLGSAMRPASRADWRRHYPRSRSAASTTLRCSAVSAACGGMGSPTA